MNKWENLFVLQQHDSSRQGFSFILDSFATILDKSCGNSVKIKLTELSHHVFVMNLMDSEVGM